MSLDSNSIITGFDNAPEAKRRVDALLDSPRVQPLARGRDVRARLLGVRHLRQPPAMDEAAESPIAQSRRSRRHSSIASPAVPVYYTDDTICVEFVSGEVILAVALEAGDAQMVS